MVYIYIFIFIIYGLNSLSQVVKCLTFGNVCVCMCVCMCGGVRKACCGISEHSDAGAPGLWQRRGRRTRLTSKGHRGAVCPPADTHRGGGTPALFFFFFFALLLQQQIIININSINNKSKTLMCTPSPTFPINPSINQSNACPQTQKQQTKQDDAKSKTTRDIFIGWIGPKVGIVQKGRKKAHVGEVKELLKVM